MAHARAATQLELAGRTQQAAGRRGQFGGERAHVGGAVDVAVEEAQPLRGTPKTCCGCDPENPVEAINGG